MRFRGLLVALVLVSLSLSPVSLAQAAGQARPAAPAPPAPRPQAAPPASDAQQQPRELTPAAEPDKVPPNAPVITVQGLCADAAAPKTAECSTVITREQFEKLTSALDPNMSQQSRSSVADQYAKILVMADEAARHGVANSPRAQEVLRFVRLQVLANLYNQELQEQSKTTTPEAAQKYYDAHQSDFEEVSLRRIVVPRNVPADAKKLTETELAALATDLDTRARAGEDFDKLQKAAFDAENIKSPTPPTTLGAQRRSSFAPAHLAAISQLKPGEISSVLADPAGDFIYKLESQRTLPLDQVQPDVQRALQAEAYQNQLADAFGGIKASLNPQYFGAFATVNLPGRPQPPAAAPAPPTLKPPSNPK